MRKEEEKFGLPKYKKKKKSYISIFESNVLHFLLLFRKSKAIIHKDLQNPKLKQQKTFHQTVSIKKDRLDPKLKYPDRKMDLQKWGW